MNRPILLLEEDGYEIVHMFGYSYQPRYPRCLVSFLRRSPSLLRALQIGSQLTTNTCAGPGVFPHPSSRRRTNERPFSRGRAQVLTYPTGASLTITAWQRRSHGSRCAFPESLSSSTPGSTTTSSGIRSTPSLARRQGLARAKDDQTTGILTASSSGSAKGYL